MTPFRRILAALVALAATGTGAHAACVAETPLDSARWFFQNHYYFFQQRTEPAVALLSPELRTAMDAQWRCTAGASCPVSVDPWTNAATGSVRDPIVFSLRTSPPDRTRVAMRFMLGNDAAEAPSSAELVWIRDSTSGCWVLDELVGGGGVSLRSTLATTGR